MLTSSLTIKRVIYLLHQRTKTGVLAACTSLVYLNGVLIWVNGIRNRWCKYPWVGGFLTAKETTLQLGDGVVLLLQNWFCQLEMGIIWFSHSYCPASPMPTYHSVGNTVSKRKGRPVVSWEEALSGKETMSKQYWESMNCSYSFILGPHDWTLQYWESYFNIYSFLSFLSPIMSNNQFILVSRPKHSHEHQL